MWSVPCLSQSILLGDETNISKVVGAGAVGLAIARRLAERDGTSTLLIERHRAVGTETSSRNSEAGLLYTPTKVPEA